MRAAIATVYGAGVECSGNSREISRASGRGDFDGGCRVFGFVYLRRVIGEATVSTCAHGVSTPFSRCPRGCCRRGSCLCMPYLSIQVVGETSPSRN